MPDDHSGYGVVGGAAAGAQAAISLNTLLASGVALPVGVTEMLGTIGLVTAEFTLIVALPLAVIAWAFGGEKAYNDWLDKQPPGVLEAIPGARRKYSA
jgi:hypothetical protein